MSVEMTRCEKCGSFYDRAKNAVCPYCNGAQAAVDKTVPVNPGVTMSVTSNDRTIPTGSVTRPTDDERTMPVFRKETGIDPVVGWLVCVSGDNLGRDYRIHSDNNYIGRSEKMDIYIRDDETISRENHATITYDSRDKVFYLTPGEGRSIVRLNDKALLMTSELKAYDRIELGTTMLVFVPLCGESFDWRDEIVTEDDDIFGITPEGEKIPVKGFVYGSKNNK